MAAVAAGFDVVGFDLDVDRTKNLADGTSFTADVPDEELRRALATGRYTATDRADDCAGFDVAVITVPTPLREGDPDLSYIAAAASTLAVHLRRGSTVVLESTTYPGTTVELMVCRCSKRDPGCAPPPTSPSATARSASTRATTSGSSAT